MREVPVVMANATAPYMAFRNSPSLAILSQMATALSPTWHGFVPLFLKMGFSPTTCFAIPAINEVAIRVDTIPEVPPSP